MLKLYSHFSNFTKRAFTDKYLFYTNVSLSIALSGVGDVIEQKYEMLKGEMNAWDKKRTKYMATAGCTVGIFCHHWYNFIDHRLPGRSIRIVLKKVLVDQTVASPIVILLFFATLGVLKKASLEETWDEVKDKAIRLYTAEWIIWPPAQIINFYILPTKYRVLYDNTISLGYDVYTSYVINDDCKKHKLDEENNHKNVGEDQNEEKKEISENR